MSDLQSTLDAINQLAVHECGWCRVPLAHDGPSPDFCGDQCQSAWLSRKQEIVELVGYREPSDLPQHYSNQRELSNAETTPRRWTYDLLRGLRCYCATCSNGAVRRADGWESIGDGLVMRIEPDLEPLRQASASLRATRLLLGDRVPSMPDLRERIRRLGEAVGVSYTAAATAWGAMASAVIDAQEARRQLGLSTEYEDQDADEPQPESPQERALRLRRTRNTGPQQRTRAPRRIDARRTR